MTTQVFDELLLDADWAINNGNWMWLSCSCFFYQYFRCYSPVAFPQKYDKKGEYLCMSVCLSVCLYVSLAICLGQDLRLENSMSKRTA